jgi:regulator of protease activity HflC (stomatin/prohibitin superfamily)
LRNALLGWFCAVASGQAADVVVLTYAGAMGPISASYIARGISEAEAPRQTCITKNNAAMSIDFLVFWKVTKQMSAERSLRAMVTSAEGDRQAKITVADGEKQAAILKAAGDRQSAILRAEGYALALDKVFSVAKSADGNTMAMQYLEALKTLGAGPATKFIFPMEFASFLKPFANLATPSGGATTGEFPSRRSRLTPSKPVSRIESF